MRDKAGMKFDCIFEETLDFIDINYTHLNMIVRYEKRPHGEWILDAVSPCSISWFRCSYCGYKYEAYKHSNFCPNCGASMMKEGDEK
jgi:rubrerythrin